MKITVIIQTFSEGCAYWRLYLPHKDMPEVTFLNDVPDKFDCDILVFHKGWISLEAIKKAQSEGIKVVVDFDDWIEVPKDHLLQDYNKQTDNFIQYLQTADLITCSTDYLKKELFTYITTKNNIIVIPNALNELELPEIKSVYNLKSLIFGYSGGKCHLPDLEQLKGLTARLQSDPATRNDYYFNLFGWYQDKVKQSYYDILSGNGIYPKRVIKTPYIQTTDYLNIYNAMDVSLVPLKENLFNCCKSELKMIEAGFFKKSVIIQNIFPYKNVITDKNCLKIDNKFQWFKNMKYLIQNPAKVQDLGEQLYQDIRQKYDLNYWNNYRMEVYENLLRI